MRNRPLMPPSRLALCVLWCAVLRAPLANFLFFKFLFESWLQQQRRSISLGIQCRHLPFFAPLLFTLSHLPRTSEQSWRVAGWLAGTHSTVHMGFVAGTRAAVVIDSWDNWYEMLNSNATVSSNLPSAALALPSPSLNGISYAQKIHSTDGYSNSDTHTHSLIHTSEEKTGNKQPSDRLNISSTWVLVWNQREKKISAVRSKDSASRGQPESHWWRGHDARNVCGMSDGENTMRDTVIQHPAISHEPKTQIKFLPSCEHNFIYIWN